MNKYYQKIQEVIDFIENNLSNDLSINSVSDFLDLSPWHFQRMFKGITGDSVGNYIKGRRLTQAALLLKESDQKIIDIAFNFGFNSQAAFTRSFSSYFNCSPLEFRKLRPSILNLKKPYFSNELLLHLKNGVNQQPSIIREKERIIVGQKINVPSPLSGFSDYDPILYPFWVNFGKRIPEISNAIDKKFFGISISESGNHQEDVLDYVAGVEVRALGDIPREMCIHRLPEQLYAVFDVTGRCASVARTVDYIYGVWLPTSEYKRGQGDDYELFDENYEFSNQNSKSKYAVPIVFDSLV